MSKIPWCDVTWNATSGCTPISEGCTHCYAKRMAYRLKGRYGYPVDDPFRVTFHPDRLDEPLKWKKPRRIFVSSMGDLWHDNIKDNWIDSIFIRMAFCPYHIFILLTKRPSRMLDYLTSWQKGNRDNISLLGNDEGYLQEDGNRNGGGFKWPLPHIWLGVTTENQDRADERIPILLQIPAAVRFVSVEPMLEKIDLEDYLTQLGSETCDLGESHRNKICNCRFEKVDWVICGAETGPGKRPMNIEWAYDLQRQCGEAGVPFFFKKDSDGEFPSGFRREWPK